MITLTINGRTLNVAPGTLLISAARQLQIPIPTLCHTDGQEHYTSCLLCVVENRQSGKLIPACSTRTEDRMVIETENDRIHTARKNTLELLLSEHTGDCFAPCQRACPAHFNIPLVMKHITDNNWAQALNTIQESIPFPAVIGRICQAPCEKVCRRKHFDSSVTICKLEQLTGDFGLVQPAAPFTPPYHNQKVAIIGAGAAGLSAAFYLLRLGYTSTLFDKLDLPGGSLYSTITEKKLDPEILQLEIRKYLLPYTELRMQTTVGEDISLEMLRKDFAAIILTPGALNHRSARLFNVDFTDYGIAVQSDSFQTSTPGIFAGGNAVKPMHFAVSAIAHGKQLAETVHQYLDGQYTKPQPFLSIINHLTQEEISGLAQLASSDSALQKKQNTADATEALRCLHCDCLKTDDCALRRYSLAYGASSHHFIAHDRAQLVRIPANNGIIFEPGKCIKCGICVRITSLSGHGLCFQKRGYETIVYPPLNVTLQEALGEYGTLCVTSCPTGAIAFGKVNTNENK